MRAAVIGVAVLAAGCVPAPVPEGYVFPTWNTGSGGAAALLEGRLVEEHGCLYIEPVGGNRFLIVWPDSFRLLVSGGAPTVVDDAGASVTVGGSIRLGGGEISGTLVPTSAAACDHSHVWGGNELLPPT